MGKHKDQMIVLMETVLSKIDDINNLTDEDLKMAMEAIEEFEGLPPWESEMN